MKIGIIAPGPIPATRGGAERALDGLHAAIDAVDHLEAELIKLPVDESDLPGLLAAYEAFADLDVSAYDRVICCKYPAWMVDHPHKTVLMMHPLRGLYDTYELFGLPLRVPNPSDHTFAMVHLMTQAHHRGALDEFFERWHNALAALGADHPDFAFPGPFARIAVHWLDAIAMAPGAVAQYAAISRTVAYRPEYFPAGIDPTIVYLPSDLPVTDAGGEEAVDEPGPDGGRPYLFTVSRLDGPKRLDLLIDAMAEVPHDVDLLIGGTGPEREALERRAAGDARIRFLGFTADEDLPALYRGALAVPFVPADEDLGLITLEAYAQGTMVITCRDSGGPTEFVKDGVTGYVAEPNAASLARALRVAIDDPDRTHRLGRAGAELVGAITWGSVLDGVLGEERYPPEERARREAETLARADALAAAAGPDRVVVLTTFAIDRPGHGGQIRARRLYGALARHRRVHVVALVDFGGQPATTELEPGLTQTVVPRSSAHHRGGEELSLDLRTPASDLASGTLIDASPEYLRAVNRAVRGARAVVLAEPYLVPVIDRLELDLPVIYDAYNVESQLKASVYPDTAEGRDALDRVRALERRALELARRITTCSLDDAEALARLGAPEPDAFVVVPNGTELPATVPDPATRAARSARWRRRYWRAGSMEAEPHHLAVFFGSWHQPNVDAAELLIDIAPCLDGVLVLAVGRHGDALAHRSTPSNLVFTGAVSERAKDQLLGAADVALNPMRIGSGTNLKLLEYLAGAIPVVSTPFGARGIDVVDGTHLRFAEPDAFAAAVREVLADPAGAAQRAEAGRLLVAERYGWAHLGSVLAEAIDALGEPGARAVRQ